MGLGPPVCKKCKVIGSITVEGDPLYGIKVPWGTSYWHCPICRSPDMEGHLFEYTDDQQDDLEGNTLFLKFMKGVE